MLGRIMVPVDGSAFAETALPTALLLARRHGSEIHLVRVHDPQLPATPESAAVYDVAIDREFEAEGRRYLDTLLGRIDVGERSGTVTAYLRGPVTEALSGYAREQAIDLVVMTTHARGAVGRAWLGSVADGLVRLSVAPVLLIPPGRKSPPGPVSDPVFRRVLLPMDGGTAEDRMLEHAITLAGTVGVEYTLLRVVTSGAPSVRPARPRRGENPGSRVQRATVKVALGVKANELRARGMLVRPEVVVNNDAAEGILSYTSENEFDLVAMATRSRGGLERLLLGSVADRVLRKAETALLLWNPGQAPAAETVEAPGILVSTPAPARL